MVTHDKDLAARVTRTVLITDGLIADQTRRPPRAGRVAEQTPAVVRPDMVYTAA